MKRLFLICLLAALLTLCGCGSNQTEEHALERLEAYAQAIDYSYKEPGKIYAFLCQDFRDQMDEEAFARLLPRSEHTPI